MEGEIKVEGDLEYHGSPSDYYLYSLWGDEEMVFVVSDDKLEEGDATVSGRIEKLDDTLYLEV